MRNIVFILAILSILTLSCEKNKTALEGGIYIFLLSDDGSQKPLWEIDESQLIQEESPLINYQDILSYNSKNHTFKISSAAQNTFKSRQMTLHTKTFALVANDEIIYTGYFWASFSSATCPWLTIDPIHAEYSGELRVELGYPGLMDEWNIPDRRNDNQILSILRHDHKLIE